MRLNINSAALCKWAGGPRSEWVWPAAHYNPFNSDSLPSCPGSRNGARPEAMIKRTSPWQEIQWCHPTITPQSLNRDGGIFFLVHTQPVAQKDWKKAQWHRRVSVAGHSSQWTVTIRYGLSLSGLIFEIHQQQWLKTAICKNSSWKP